MTRPAGSDGFGGRAGFGERPALLVVDMSLGFTDAESPLACDLAAPLAATRELLSVARGARIPVVFTTVAYRAEDRPAAALLLAKMPALGSLEAGSRWVELDPRVAALPGEPVLTKLFASPFAGTPLAALLSAATIDTVVVAGASTSGCVRATVVDVVQHGMRGVVVREAVGDRDRAAHEQSLADIDAKYGDVLALAEVTAAIAASGERRQVA